MNYTVTNKTSGKSVTINYIQQMCNGTWQIISEEHMKKLLKAAVGYQPELTSVEQAHEQLLNAGTIKFDDEWYAKVGVQKADQPQPQKSEYSRSLDCGCTVYDPSHIMQTSYQGTACPDCYDKIESQGYVRRKR